MKEFVFKNKKMIPECRMQDVVELRNFIVRKLHIQISLLDTYLFWDAVSTSWSAGWLYIETHYEDETREEFLLNQLRKFGTIIGDEDYDEDDYEDENPSFI